MPCLSLSFCICLGPSPNLHCILFCTYSFFPKVCLEVGCTTHAKRRGLCNKHGAKGVCSSPGCSTNAYVRHQAGHANIFLVFRGTVAWDLNKSIHPSIFFIKKNILPSPFSPPSSSPSSSYVFALLFSFFFCVSALFFFFLLTCADLAR